MFKFFKKSKPTTAPAPKVRTYKVCFVSYSGPKVTYVEATSSNEACHKVMNGELYDARKYILHNDRRDFSVTPLYVDYAIAVKEN